jgi:hypothetical protein
MSASACAWPVNSCRHAELGQPLLPGARLDRLEGQTALPELVSCLLSLAAGGRARVGHAVLPPKLHVASRRLGAGGARHCRSAVSVTPYRAAVMPSSTIWATAAGSTGWPTMYPNAQELNNA